MEAKFFSEIEKKMDVKTLKDFEKDVRTQINNEFESLRKKNDDLSRVLMAGECEMWKKIRNEEYSWLKLKGEKKNKLYRLIDIYSEFDKIVDSVKDLNKKYEKVKQLKKISNIKYYFYPPKYSFMKSLLSSSKCGLCITFRILLPRCLSNR